MRVGAGGATTPYLLLTMYNLGARVSEISGLRQNHVTFGAKSYVQLHGKGRKDRSIPLWPRTARVLRDWFRELGQSRASDGIPEHSRRASDTVSLSICCCGKRLSGHPSRCTTLKKKRVSPRLVRHATAMALLQSGADIAVIALWLGHESIETTNVYVHANLAMKEKALAKVAPIGRRFPAIPRERSLAGVLGIALTTKGAHSDAPPFSTLPTSPE